MKREPRGKRVFKNYHVEKRGPLFLTSEKFRTGFKMQNIPTNHFHIEHKTKIIFFRSSRICHVIKGFKRLSICLHFRHGVRSTVGSEFFFFT